MSLDEIIEKMREGYELANRGTGWWLNAPRSPYQTVEPVQIDDAKVNELVAVGKIKTELPHNTLFARLIG